MGDHRARNDVRREGHVAGCTENCFGHKLGGIGRKLKTKRLHMSPSIVALITHWRRTRKSADVDQLAARSMPSELPFAVIDTGFAPVLPSVSIHSSELIASPLKVQRGSFAKRTVSRFMM